MIDLVIALVFMVIWGVVTYFALRLAAWAEAQERAERARLQGWDDRHARRRTDLARRVKIDQPVSTTETWRKN